MKKYESAHNICIKYIQSASSTCDEPLKKVCDKEKKSILLIYLFKHTYLPT
jgi:hypothetical protein